jgi:hypothetical protein
VIEGDAGIGKTTVWLEARAAAESLGFRVLGARPAESEVKLSYAVLADRIGSVFKQTWAELPEPQQRALGAALLRDDAEGRFDARTVGTAFVGFLTALAADRPRCR